MDFFDVRKLTAGQSKDVPSGNDYSAVAFLPVIMIGAVVLGICGVCQYKRWKHEKKQIAHLSEFYEVFEGSSFRYGKMLVLEHPDIDEACCDRIRRAMLLPPSDSSPFFQPGAKARSSRVDVPHKATTATEVIFHFTNLSAESRKVSIDDLSESEIEHIV